jgi:hypothetical protein
MIDGLPAWAALIPFGMLCVLGIAILVSPHSPSRNRHTQSREVAVWGRKRAASSRNQPGHHDCPWGVRPSAGPGTPEPGPADGIIIRTRKL